MSNLRAEFRSCHLLSLVVNHSPSPSGPATLIPPSHLEDWLELWQLNVGTSYPSLGSTLQPHFWKICFMVAVSYQESCSFVQEDAVEKAREIHQQLC